MQAVPHTAVGHTALCRHCMPHVPLPSVSNRLKASRSSSVCSSSSLGCAKSDLLAGCGISSTNGGVAATMLTSHTLRQEAPCAWSSQLSPSQACADWLQTDGIGPQHLVQPATVRQCMVQHGSNQQLRGHRAGAEAACQVRQHTISMCECESWEDSYDSTL